MNLDLATARHLYAASGRAVVPAPTHTLADPDGELPDVVMTDGPPAILHMPSSLLPPVEYLDEAEREDFFDRTLHAAGLR